MDFITARGEGSSLVIEKRSRFIGRIMHIETVSELEEAVAAVKKEHYDARHHCYAAVVGEPGAPDEAIRFTDDGEPQGTAGKPILEVLTRAGLHQTLIIVTRYFGGTLLGTGGLVRCYHLAAKEALEDCSLVSVADGRSVTVGIDYHSLAGVNRYLAERGITPSDIVYTDKVSLSLDLIEKDVEPVTKALTELTEGSASISKGGLCRIRVPVLPSGS